LETITPPMIEKEIGQQTVNDLASTLFRVDAVFCPTN